MFDRFRQKSLQKSKFVKVSLFVFFVPRGGSRRIEKQGVAYVDLNLTLPKAPKEIGKDIFKNAFLRLKIGN